MEITDRRFLVAGASGQLGERIAVALHDAGARVVAAGREQARLGPLAEQLGTDPVELEILDPNSRESAIDSAIEQLDGLDAVVVATGAVAFGRSGEIDPEAERAMLAVNAEGPIGLISSALPRLDPGGGVIALTAVVAEFPTAGMAAYSASKAALSAYLQAIRRERRKELDLVLDVRPGHMDTGFADRALAGTAPKLPEPQSVDELVAAVIDAIASGARELRYDPKTRELSPR